MLEKVLAVLAFVLIFSFPIWLNVLLDFMGEE